jgi:exonuclease III
MLIKLLFACWNVRSLGQRRKRDDVRAAIDSFLPSVLCLQETKLSDVSPFFASSFLPPSLWSFVSKNSEGASRGILTAWDDNLLEMLNHSIDPVSITTIFHLRSDSLHFTITNVYGPCAHDRKADFLSSLEQIFTSLSGPVGGL